MKRTLVAIAASSLLYMQTSVAAENTVGIGFEIGTSIYAFSESNFKSGGGNYFRLNMAVDNGMSYFMHNESGNYSAEASSGNNTSTVSGTLNVTGVGASMDLSDSTKFSLMVGSATVKHDGAANVTILRSTAPIADLGINWSKRSKRTSLDLGLSYRHSTLTAPVTFTENGKANNVTDMSSLKINIGIGYAF